MRCESRQIAGIAENRYEWTANPTYTVTFVELTLDLCYIIRVCSLILHAFSHFKVHCKISYSWILFAKMFPNHLISHWWLN